MKKLTGFLVGLLFLVNTSYAAVTWVATETKTVEGADSICIDSPSGLQLGDLMLAYIAISDDDDLDPDIGTGAAYATWTQLQRDESSQVGVWGGWRIATADDVSDVGNSDWYCFHNNQTQDKEDYAGQIRVYRGVDQVNPVDASEDNESSGLIATTPSVSTTGSYRMIVRFVGWEEQVVPAEMSPAHNGDMCLNVDAAAGITNCGADLVQDSAGISGTASWTRSDVSDNWFTLTVALTPAPTPAPAPYHSVSTMPVWVLVLTGLLLILLVRRRLVI